MHTFLEQLVVLLIAAVGSVPIFRYFRIGAILAYLFAGIIIGPYVLGAVHDTEVILHFSELGVVFLLFIIGLELEPRRLWRMRREVFGMGTLQVLLTGSLFTGAGLLFGLSLAAAFVAGFGLALSSTAFGLQILEENRQFRTQHGQGAFSILLLQDLAVVPLMASLPLLTGVGGQIPNWQSVVFFVTVITGLLFINRFLLGRWLRLVADARVPEIFVATSLLVVVGTALIVEHIGLSMGTGAFIGGMMLANSEYRHEIETHLNPFKGLLMGLFFMAVGMTLNLQVVAAEWPLIVGLVVGFMAIKTVIIFALARLFAFPTESSRNMGFVLPQGGEFAFVLFSAAVALSILDQGTGAILGSAVTLSMALTPLVFKLNQKFMRTFSEISERPADVIDADGAQVIVAGYGRFGQIVSRFLRAEEIPFTILEHSAEQVDVARKFGAKLYYGDASRQDIVTAAGGKEAKVFVLAIDDVETSLQTAKMVRENFPHMKIVARARNRQHAMDLMALGIEEIHRETLLTSLEVAKDVLTCLGRGNNIDHRIMQFRKHDEEILKRQFQLRDNEAEMLSFTTAATKQLEQVLREENSPKDQKN